jgi:hypothetical protein
MRHLQLVIATTLLAAASSGCTESASVPDGAQRISIQPLPADHPAQIFSSFDTRERLVIRDEATWTSAWEQVMGGIEPSEPAPEIDFATTLILVATMGAQISTGYAVAIDDVHTMDGDAWVTVSESSPGSRCPTGDAITRPATVVAVPRYEGETTFVERSKRVDCP